jgi:hypothetical protein
MFLLSTVDIGIPVNVRSNQSIDSWLHHHVVGYVPIVGG